MKQSLHFRLSQQFTLTPQLRQSIRLLQLSTLELDQEIEDWLRDNPLLERVDGAGEAPPAVIREADALGEHAGETGAGTVDEAGEGPGANDAALDGFDAQTGTRVELEHAPAGEHNEGDDDGFRQQAAAMPTLREHLLTQLSLLNLTDRDRVLAQLLIDALDEDGYFTQDMTEILEMLPPEVAVEAEELLTVLRHVQQLEPPGVGARGLAECLALQLALMPAATPFRDEALLVVNQHLDLLAAKDFTKLKRLLQCDDKALRVVQKLIVSLNPKPGRGFGRDEVRYVVPDVNVIKNKGLWVASLNAEAMPKLRVNSLYANLLKRERGAERPMSGQLQEARWLIKNIQQRFDTILRVSQAIVDRQRNFLEHGAIAMRPLVLREIADTLELHESTVSRVTTHKYMRTPRGIFELKFFFSSHVATDAGGSASSTAIRELIRNMVAAENAKKPLSDSQISALLAQQGIVVARRTVAKYRESLQILPGSLRKTL
jgi:RNA polymerase sigma-54 factor